MKFSFLVFLISITGVFLYAPKLKKEATGDIKQAIELFKITEKTQRKVDQDKHLQQLESLKDLQSELGFSPDKPMVEFEMKSPILDKFTKMMPKAKKSPKTLRETADEFYLKTVNFIKSVLSKYGAKITFFAFLIAFTAFVSKWIEIYRLAQTLSKLGWFFSRFALVIISLTAITLCFAMKRNLWLDVGNNLFFMPVQILVASSFAFKIMDSNFPIWNRLFGSFILPIISGIITSAAHIL